jgi:hypothetical protein
MLRRDLAILPAAAALAALVVLAVVVPARGGAAVPARAAAVCRALVSPHSLGATLLALHRAYERDQPDVHDPKITGPVGRVYLGICGAEHYALAGFDAAYNGVYFGLTDQPERFIEPPGEGWRDIGNTGGDPCGGSPTALLEAWKIVHACPAQRGPRRAP